MISAAMAAVDPSHEPEAPAGAPFADSAHPHAAAEGAPVDHAADVDPPSHEDSHEDSMAPPRQPCECYCLHCQRVFMSDQMWFQRVIGDPGGFPGFWMCPTPNCEGAGYLFDIFPTDPNHPDNRRCHEHDGDDEHDEHDEEDDDLEELLDEFEDDQDNPFSIDWLEVDEPDEDLPYDPDEPAYKELDNLLETFGDDDFEGEEWKYGLEPGQRPPMSFDAGDEEQDIPFGPDQDESRYNTPDQRPRFLDWSNREDHNWFREDDIPF